MDPKSLESLIAQWTRQAAALEFGAQDELLTDLHAERAEASAKTYRWCAKDLTELLAASRPEARQEQQGSDPCPSCGQFRTWVYTTAGVAGYSCGTCGQIVPAVARTGSPEPQA
jgi:hypothetical protein